ncbi:MAG: hypothetical protein R3F65_24500 [bacterium]|nr:hypothetical protein [Myxococcales bacterium]
MTVHLARALCAAGCLALAAPALAAPAPRAEVRAALDAIEAHHPRLHATFRPGSPVPAVLTGVAIPTVGETPRARVEGFVAAHRALFGGAELVVGDVSARGARTVARLEQRHGGLVVLDRAMTVTLDAAGRVVQMSGELSPLTTVEAATIDADAARAIALRAVLGDAAATAHTEVRRGLVALGGRGTEVFEVELMRQPLREHLVVRVDAHRGRVIGVQNRIEH